MSLSLDRAGDVLHCKQIALCRPRQMPRIRLRKGFQNTQRLCLHRGKAYNAYKRRSYGSFFSQALLFSNMYNNNIVNRTNLALAYAIHITKNDFDQIRHGI